MTTFARSVRDFEKLCDEKDVPAETAMAYLVELSQRERYDLYANYDEEMPADLAQAYKDGMARILLGEPMAHVLGYSWFYGYRMIVSPDVLIPRYETEELCANVLSDIDACFPGEEPLVCADIGTGSGAIAITLAKEEKRLSMYATDISLAALEVARQNARNNEAEVTFLPGDMLAPLIEEGVKLDVLVCNPPYIPAGEKMEQSVVGYEPHVALFGGEDGLFFYRRVFADCRKVLSKKALMAFEIGWNQREAMACLLAEYLPFARYEIRRDINGKDRMLMVYLGMDEEVQE